MAQDDEKMVEAQQILEKLSKFFERVNEIIAVNNDVKFMQGVLDEPLPRYAYRVASNRDFGWHLLERLRTRPSKT